MINLPVNVDKARLPAAYEHAKASLAKCEKIDECKTWADKAAALASYAKQAKDDTLAKHCRRIQSRAIRRAGELLKAIEPGQFGNLKRGPKLHAATTTASRTNAARAAGMGHQQQATAVRIASIPEENFEKLVESDNPPKLNALAARGKKSRKLRRATVANSVDPLLLKISELASLMDKRPADTLVSETRAQFDSGVGLDREYIERLSFVRNWLTTVIDGSQQFVVSCSTK